MSASPHQINADMCRALGIDVTGLIDVTVRIRVGQFPEIEATRLQLSAVGMPLKEIVERYHLEPAR